MTPHKIQRIIRLLTKPNTGSISYELVYGKNTALQKNCVFKATFTKERVYGISVKI